MKRRWISLVAFFLVLSCTTTDRPAESQPVLEIPPVLHSPSAPVTEPRQDLPVEERHFTSSEQNGYIFIKFDKKKIPAGTFYIEATFGESYLGYFVVGDTIALLKPKEGTKAVFLYYALDGLGNRLQEEPFKATLP